MSKFVLTRAEFLEMDPQGEDDIMRWFGDEEAVPLAEIMGGEMSLYSLIRFCDRNNCREEQPSQSVRHNCQKCSKHRDRLHQGEKHFCFWEQSRLT